MKNAVVCPETARVAIIQSAPNPAGGILNLTGATRGKLCEKRPLLQFVKNASSAVCEKLASNDDFEIVVR